jgi:hypothetical protein
VKVFPRDTVVAYRLVSRDETHVTMLALAGIKKNAIIRPIVVVAMLLARFAGEQQNYVARLRSANATLSLSPKPLVEVTAAIGSSRNKQTLLMHRFAR